MVSRKPQIVGKPFPRIEAELKLTGVARYLDDLDFGPELLYAKLVHSERAHALILDVDLTEALSLPGVKVILTGQDITGCLGTNLWDRFVLARDRVRYVGEPIAAVVAESAEIAERAVRLVSVTYKDLPVLSDVESSLRENAALLHPDSDQYRRSDFVQPKAGTNIAHYCQMKRGDLSEGWRQADIIIEHSYRVARVQHVPMETHGAVALQDSEGKITLWASTRAPFTQRQMISQALGIDPERMRVVAPRVGGDFGSKNYASIEAIAVALAMALPEQPIKLVLNRTEEFMCTFLRPGLVAHLKMGATSAGELTAVQASYDWDVGSSADAAIEAVKAAVYVGTGPYRVSNSLVESQGIYTNEPVAGPMRGNGMAEVHWAVEQHIDRMAEATGFDALTFRLQNMLKGGDELVKGFTMHATGLDQCVRQAAETIAYNQPSSKSKRPHSVRGKGLAAMWNPVLISPMHSTAASVNLNGETICAVNISGVDVGQGAYTLAAQVVASELGVPLEWVQLQPVDTDQAPIDGPTGSQLTWSMGNAVLRAARDVRQKVLAFVAAAWDEPIGNIDIIDGNIISYATERLIPLPELLAEGMVDSSGERIEGSFKGEGAFTPKSSETEVNGEELLLPVVHFSTGAQAVEVEVDVETGSIRLLHIASAIDVGHAINPDIVRAQIKGGIVQGLSTTLLEQALLEDGVFLNPNFLDYRIATIRDLPDKVEPIIIEVPQDDGPYGARGVGEHALIPTAPAIANAIYNAVGIRIDSLPITSERIWRDIQSRQIEQEII